MAEGILSSDGTQWKEKSFFGVYNHGSEPIRNSLKVVIIVPSPSHSTTLCKLFRQYLVLRFCNLLYWVLKVSFSHLHHTYRAHNLTLPFIHQEGVAPVRYKNAVLQVHKISRPAFMPFVIFLLRKQLPRRYQCLLLSQRYQRVHLNANVALI